MVRETNKHNKFGCFFSKNCKEEVVESLKSMLGLRRCVGAAMALAFIVFERGSRAHMKGKKEKE